ncbi:MAG: hypothetical protein LBF28_01905 [Rickettsiales bacterium]|jgi:hypothetical protein|nr:hypothetical protein [Rickettsiales bacterium]
MKKSLLLILSLMAAGCAGDSRPAMEMYQCGDYTVYLDPYVEKTDDLSGGLLAREGAEPVKLNSSNIVKWPVIAYGDGKTEILSKSLKTPDNKIIFQIMRYENLSGTIDTEAVFSERGIFKNGARYINCAKQ